MGKPSLQLVLRHLRDLVRAPAADEQSDGALLQHFASHRDEAAFATILRRHGPLVLGVCRQVLKDDHAADDAFQAVFMVLARKAGSIRQGQSLAGWLYRVAVNLARTCRTSAARRRRHEKQAGEQQAMARRQSHHGEEAGRHEFQPLLHEEIERLPEKYRVAVVICFLHGRTHAEAATELGWPVGTVKGRLGRAKELLHRRLARRGLALPAAGLAALLSESAATAEVPALLEQAALQAALEFASPLTAGALSSPAVALAERTITIMMLNRLKLAATLLFLATFAGVVVGGLAYQSAAPRPTQPGPPEHAVADDPELAPRKEFSPRLDRFGDPLPPGALLRLGTHRFRRPGDGADWASLAYSPDGKNLVFRAHGWTSLFDAATGKKLRHNGQLSPDGTILATRDADKNILLWDVASGNKRGELTGAGKLAGWLALSFSPDGKTLVSGSTQGVLQLWEVATCRELRRLEHQTEVTSVVFSPDGRNLASHSLDTIRLWDTVTGKQLQQLRPRQGEEFLRVVFSPDSKTVATGSWSGLRLWEVATGKELPALPDAPPRVCGLAFSPDGTALAAASTYGNRDVRLLDLATGKERRRLLPSSEVQALAFSADSKHLATASPASPWAIELWDAATGKQLNAQFQGHESVVDVIVLAPDGKTAATWDRRMVLLWDLATGKKLHELQAPFHWPFRIAFFAEGKALAAVYGDKVQLWDVASGKDVRAWKLDHKLEQNVPGSVAFSADGLTVASADNNYTIHLWEPATGKELRQWKVPTNHTQSLAFSADGKTLASAQGDGTLCLWETATGQEKLRISKLQETKLTRLPTIKQLAFSADGKTLFTLVGLNDHTLHLWETATGQERLRFKGMWKEFALSPDGKFVLGPKSGTAFVWDAATGKELRQLAGHLDTVWSVAFSADGRRAATGGQDTTVLVWDAAGLDAARPLQAAELEDKQVEALWADLAGDDAGRAYQAIGVLSRTPRQALPFLRAQLRPMPAPDRHRLGKWLADLDSDDFAIREKASSALEQLGEQAEPALRRLQDETPSPEVRRRVATLLGKLNGWTGERLRSWRAIEVLESIGTPEARAVLQGLAGGADGARLTEEAKAALQRLGRRTVTTP